MSTKFSRRSALKSGLVLLGSSALPMRSLGAAEAAEPHFFIFVNLFYGADSSYLFDARPLAMTAAGKIQNYSGAESIPWVGANGTKTLANALVEPLKQYKDDFSIINGVIMANGFEGHEQNQNYIFSGNPFGGESFIPHLNMKDSLPLDNLSAMDLFGVTISNGGSSLTSGFNTLASLGQTFAGADASGTSNPTAAFMQQRMQAASQGNGAFSAGARNMVKGFANSGSLVEKLKNVQIVPPTPADPEVNTAASGSPVHLQVIEQFFKQGISRSLVFGFDEAFDFDTHGSFQAQAQPQLFAKVAATVAELIGYLKATPYSSTQSLFDVTTVLVGSEFGRTMRQEFAQDINSTGTDHNTLSNSYLIAGKGIVGGQVVGASDLTSVNEQGELQNVSGAHKERDASLIKLMGKPFDFSTFQPVDTLPEIFDPTQYIGFGAVANTLYQAFGLKSTEVPYRRFSAGGNIIPGLKPLLR